MKPKKTETPQGELFRNRLENIINMDHELVQVAGHIDWAGLEEKFGRCYVENVGRPGCPTRLMVGLHYLKYAFDQSDERALATFLENPYWQYFCGFEYFQHELPINPTSLVKWRQRADAGGAEELFKQTIKTACDQKLITPSELDRVNVDTTVQEKAVTFPTDAKLYDKARRVLVKLAGERGIVLRQTYARVGKRAVIMQGRYRHARQAKRARRETRKLRTWLGRVIRDIERKCPAPDEKLATVLATAGQIFRQERHDRNKTYSVHAPEVECIAKGKAHKKYEFGCKTSFVSTSRGNWIVGALAIHGNPYDGHTLEAAITQTVGLTGRTPSDIYCDRGYRGAKIETDGDCRVHLDGKKPKGLTRAEKKWLKRRSAIEPVIGHLKQDHRLDRNHLLGEIGDRMNAIFAAAGFNLRKLLRFFLRPGGSWQKSSGLLLYLCPFETGDPRNRENRIKITPSIYHHHCLTAG